MKKYKVDFSTNSAIEEIITEKGNKIINRFLMFCDGKGIHIRTRSGIVYLTPENCEVI